MTIFTTRSMAQLQMVLVGGSLVAATGCFDDIPGSAFVHPGPAAIHTTSSA
jgi:hypothetical protein